MKNNIKQLNFNSLLILDTDVSKYNYEIYLKNNGHKIKGFCTKCDEKKVNTCPKNKKFKLRTISHGASSQDFIQSINDKNIELTNWKEDSVIFLLEGPSVGHDFYGEEEYNGYVKWPTLEWYWVHNNQNKYVYPENFKGGTYGELFRSIIFTFCLKNAYFTNFVKCGLNDKDTNYLGINEYNPECLDICFNEYLLKEIKLIKPKIIFCFGSNPENKLWNYYPDDYEFEVISLPHPAGQRRGFKNEFYRHLYFNVILEGLYNTGIYSLDETIEKYKLFLEK
jgi:hypothetical protein